MKAAGIYYKSRIKDIILVSLFTALMVVGAFVRIPFPLLPVTLQPFFCAFAGIMLGSGPGALSQSLYMIIGLAGLPVFAQGGGISYVCNPAFGFLIGFIAGAFLIGRVSALLKNLGFKNCLISVYSGLIAIYATGMLYMYLILHFYLKKQEANFLYVVITNLPYFVKDLILYVIVALVASSVVPVLKRANLY